MGKTEISAPTQYPSFQTSNFLLPYFDEDPDAYLLLAAFIVVNPELPPAASNASNVKKLGEATISLKELGLGGLIQLGHSNALSPESFMNKAISPAFDESVPLRGKQPKDDNSPLFGGGAD